MKRAHKFGARKSSCVSGHMHPSAKEARRCNELHILRRAGHIRDLEVEPQFFFTIDGRQLKHLNGRRAGFKPDFGYRLADSDRRIVEDCKGGAATKTEAYVLRVALFRHLHPEIELREV